MPDWRRETAIFDWPLSRVPPADASWTQSMKGGRNGMLALIVGLAIWWKNAATDGVKAEVASAIEDLVYAFGAMNADM